MDLDDLKTFVEVADTGGVAEAGRPRAGCK